MGHVNASIVGSLANLTIVSALAIADTNAHISGSDGIAWLDVSGQLGKRRIIVESTLNQPISLTILGKRSVTGTTVWLHAAAITVNSGSGLSIADSAATNQIPGLDAPIFQLGIKIQCTVAPTSGSVSIFLLSNPF